MSGTRKGCLYVGKIASYRAPARAVKIVKLLEILNQDYEMKVVSQYEPGIDYSKFEIQNLTVVRFFGVSFRKLAFRKQRESAQYRHSYLTVTDKKKNQILFWIKKFLYPDPYLVSIFATYRAAQQGLAQNTRVVITSGYPFSNIFVGLLLKLRNKDVEWIIELRDPYVGNRLAGRGQIFKFLDRLFEKIFIRYASKIMIYKGWYPGGIKVLLSRYPNAQDKFVELPYCGFDGDIVLTKHTGSSQRFDGKLNIIHAGNFYGGDYSPIKLIEAVRLLKADHLIKAGDLIIQFYGDIDNEYNEIVKNAGLQDFFEFPGLVPYVEMQKRLGHADVLLWITGSTVSYPDNIPTKVFDYIGAEKLIWALIPPKGLAYDFVKANSIRYSNTSSISDIQNSLRKLLFEFSKGELSCNLPDRNEFSLQNCCRQFLNEVKSL